jgi:YesN/AraC family two-component response regulator
MGKSEMDYTWEIYGDRHDARDVRLYETIVHRDDMPFRIFNIKRSRLTDEHGMIVDVMDHWHPELEIVYVFKGHSTHYIDGRCYEAAPDRLFIVNPNSIHKIISDKTAFEGNDIVAVSLNVKYDFVANMIPDLEENYFAAALDNLDLQVQEIMKELSIAEEREAEWDRYEGLRLTGLLCELMGILCRAALMPRDDAILQKNIKSQERLKSVLKYIGEHYTEQLTQQQIAAEFYLTKEYFCKFFKQNTGMTFKEYLSDYRVNMARNDLLNSEKSILEIALENGFTDTRGYINAFKKLYGTTPLHYRKDTGKVNFL